SPGRNSVAPSATSNAVPRTIIVTAAPSGNGTSDSGTPHTGNALSTKYDLSELCIGSLDSITIVAAASGVAVPTTPNLRASHATIVPGISVLSTTIKNTTSKIRRPPVMPAITGIVASTTGTAPRNPTIPMNVVSRNE